MIAGIYNITCEQGATFTRTFTITDPDGDIVDLSGYTGRMQVRRDVESSAALIELTSANGRLVITPLLGEITINLTPALTAGITRDGIYDLEIVNTTSGVVYRVLKGSFKIDKEVTR
jgi:predicted secreted Zn-dependent protease